MAWFFCLGLGEGISQAAFLGLALSVVGVSIKQRRLCADLKHLWQQQDIKLLILLVAWLLFSAFMSPYGWPRLSHLSKLWSMLSFVVTWWAIDLLGPSSEQAKIRAVWAFFCMLAVASVFGLLQHRYGFEQVAQLLHIPPERQIIEVPPHSGHIAATGFYFNRLKFAYVLLIGLSFLWCFLVTRFLSANRLSLNTLGILILFLLLFVTLFFTYTRAYLLAFAGAAFVFSLWIFKMYSFEYKKKRRVLFVLGVFLLTITTIVLFIPSVKLRMQSITSAESLSDRLFIWQRAFTMFFEHPFLGVGYGQYDKACQSYYNALNPHFEMRTAAHNQWLTFLVEAGPIALVLWCVWWYQLLKNLLSQKLKSGLVFKNADFNLGLMIMGVVLLSSFVHDPFFQHVSTMAVMGSLALSRASWRFSSC